MGIIGQGLFFYGHHNQTTSKEIHSGSGDESRYIISIEIYYYSILILTFTWLFKVLIPSSMCSVPKPSGHFA